jgi:2-haloacid dehalogenase
MTLEAVFIDAGNTLLYEKPSRFEIYAQAARRRGLELTTEHMAELMRRAHRELPREIEGAFRYSEAWFTSYIHRIFHDVLDLSRSEVPAIREELFARFAEPQTFVLFPGAVELLESLRGRGLAIGIVSNWSQRLPGVLNGLGLADRIDFVLASAIERVEKPDPENSPEVT